MVYNLRTDVLTVIILTVFQLFINASVCNEFNAGYPSKINSYGSWLLPHA